MHYKITSENPRGVTMGTYPGDSEEEAILAMAIDHGYNSIEELELLDDCAWQESFSVTPAEA